jgi:LysR family transcriptional regulator, hypochlorite-specific transcription factor HypT
VRDSLPQLEPAPCVFHMPGLQAPLPGTWKKLVEVNWLKDFLAVASTGNFSRAAETRNVTQPAFSRRLKALELWIGVPLLDRSSYPITLTEAGVRFLPVAEGVLRDLHAGRDDVRLTAALSGTTLKFAMPHSLAVGFFPKWWQVMTAAQVGMTAKVIADNFHDCIEMLLNGACHALLCYRNDAVPNPLSGSGCPGIAIDCDRLVAVSAPGADGGPLHNFRAGAAARIPFLNYAPDAFLGKVTASLLNAATPRLSLELRYESAFAEAVRAHALAGGGIAWLPRSLIVADLNERRLVPADASLPEAELEIWLYRAAQASSLQLENLWGAAKGLSEVKRPDA